MGVQTGVHGFDSRTPRKFVVSKTSEADIWLSSYDHLTDVGGQRGGCRQLSQRKRGKGDKQGESMVASYMYLGVYQSGITNDLEQ